MRSLVIIGLAFAVAPAFGAEKPIPQNIAKMEKHRSDWLEWNRRTTVGAYDRVGKKDPKWDKPARESLEYATRMFTAFLYPAAAYDELCKLTKVAIDAGCDDPLVVYLYNRSLGGLRYPASSEMKASARALGANRYPAFRRALVLSFDVAEDTPTKQAEVEAVLAFLSESVKSDEHNEFCQKTWFRALGNLIKGYRNAGLSAIAAYER